MACSRTRERAERGNEKGGAAGRQCLPWAVDSIPSTSLRERLPWNHSGTSAICGGVQGAGGCVQSEARQLTAAATQGRHRGADCGGVVGGKWTVGAAALSSVVVNMDDNELESTVRELQALSVRTLWRGHAARGRCFSRSEAVVTRPRGTVSAASVSQIEPIVGPPQYNRTRRRDWSSGIGALDC